MLYYQITSPLLIIVLMDSGGATHVAGLHIPVIACRNMGYQEQNIKNTQFTATQ